MESMKFLQQIHYLINKKLILINLLIVYLMIKPRYLSMKSSSIHLQNNNNNNLSNNNNHKGTKNKILVFNLLIMKKKN